MTAGKRIQPLNSEINPYQGTLHGGKPDPAEPQPRKWGPNLLGCLGIIVILGLFAALFLPMPRTAGESARRVQGASNLKQIGIALHTYHDKYGALPPAYTVDTNG